MTPSILRKNVLVIVGSAEDDATSYYGNTVPLPNLSLRALNAMVPSECLGSTASSVMPRWTCMHSYAG